MALLSNLFGNGGSNSDTSGNQSDFTSDLDAVIALNASNESYESYSDGDESYESYDAQDFGIGIDIGSMVDSLTSSFSDSDSTSFG